MILRKIRLVNFRIFRGENQITFPLPGGKSITVLIGENQSGKTTLIHAFRWCLYGKSAGMANPEDLLNHFAFAAADFDVPLDVAVTLDFEHDGSAFRAHRFLKCSKRDGGILRILEEGFRVDETDRDGQPQEVPNPKTRVQEILPTSMAPFFFFEGEAAKGWAAETGGIELRRGVEDCLDLSVLTRADEHLQQRRADFRQERKESSTGDAEEIDKQIQALEELQKTKNAQLEEKKLELFAAGAQKIKVETDLASIKETAPLVNELKQLRNDRTTLSEKLDEIEIQLGKFIAKDGLLAFIGKASKATQLQVADAYKRDQIPAKFKPSFVDELLKREACICDASLAEGTPNRAALLKWKSGAGLSDISERIAVLENKLKDVDFRRQRAFIADGGDYANLRRRQAEELTNLAKVEGRIRDLDSDLRGKDWRVEHIDELQAKRNRLDDEINDLRFAVLEIERELGLGKFLENEASIAWKLADLELKARDLQKADAKGRVLTQRIEFCDKIRAAAVKLRDGWLDVVQKYLDAQAKKSYEAVGQLNRRVSVGENFALSVEKDVNGRWQRDAPSESNQGVVALCFISAFIKLAKRLADEAKSGAGQLLRGGAFPMVMDAPFSDWDSHFCRTVSHHLAETVPQLVVITKHRDWPHARAVLENRIGRAYVIHFHGRNAVTSSVEFLGQKVIYTSKDEPAEPEYSIIEEVKP